MPNAFSAVVLLLKYTLTSYNPTLFHFSFCKKLRTNVRIIRPLYAQSIQTVLVWRESSSINIDVWINLDRRDS